MEKESISTFWTLGYSISTKSLETVPNLVVTTQWMSIRKRIWKDCYGHGTLVAGNAAGRDCGTESGAIIYSIRTAVALRLGVFSLQGWTMS